MKFPVDFLAGVSQAELQASAQSYMTELLYSNPDNHEHLTLPDSTKLPINISTVGQVPLYGSSDTEKVLALFAPADPITPAALYLVDRWWTMEDILHTAENTRDGAKQVETVGERIVLYVLNRIIYRAQEMSPDELPFLCHGETDFAKILWSNGEAVGFYSVKPTGSPCSPFSSRTYPFPVMDSMFVRKRCRGKGLGLKMLQDYVDSFKEDSLGVRYPLTTAMYKVCESYLQAFPGDSELLWEVDSSRLNQRITISNKIQSMNMRALSKTLTYSDKSGAIHHGTTEGAVMEEISRTVTESRCIHCSRETVEEVTIVRSKGCEEVPVSTRGRSTGSKQRTGQKQTEEQHSVIRITEEVNLSRLEKDSEVVQTEDLLNMAIENGTDITVTEGEEEEATFHKSLQTSEESVTLATEESITQNSLCSTVMPVENVASEMESSHTAETEEKLNHETIEDTAPPQRQVTMERVLRTRIVVNIPLTSAAEDEADMEKPADEPEVTHETISVDNETAEDHTEEDKKEEPVIHRRPLKGRRSAKTPPRSTRTSKRHKTAEEEETEEDTEPGIELEKDIVDMAEEHIVEETEDTIEKTSEAVVSAIAADKEASEQHEPEEVGETRVLRRSGRYQKTEEIVGTTVVKRGWKSKGRVTRQKELELEASSAEEDVIEEPQTEHQTSTENTLALPVAEDLNATVVTETTEKQVETAEDTKEKELPQAEEDTVERAEEPVAAETEDTVEEMAVEDSASAEAAEEKKIEEAASTADVELVPVRTTDEAVEAVETPSEAVEDGDELSQTQPPEEAPELAPSETQAPEEAAEKKLEEPENEQPETIEAQSESEACVAVETPEAVEAGDELSEAQAPEEAPELAPSETQAPEQAADTKEAESDTVIPEQEELSPKQTEAEEVIQTRTRRSRAKTVNETPTPRVTRSRKSKTPEEIVETTPVKRGRKSTGRKQVTKPEEPALVLEASSAEEDNTAQPQIADEAPLETASLPLPAEAETDQNEPMEDSEITAVTETKAKEAEMVEGTAAEEEIKEQEPSLAEEDTIERAEEPVAAETEDTVEEMAVEDSASAEAAEEEKIEQAASTADVEPVPVRTTDAEDKEHAEISMEVDKESQPETVMEEKEAEPEEPEEPAPSVETRSLRSGSKTVKATPGRRRTAARLASQEETQDRPLEEPENEQPETIEAEAFEAVEAPSEAMEAPSEAVETPSEAVETPSEAVETPSEAVETSSETVETPSVAVETPSEAVETPSEAVETPSEAVETPSEAVETPSEAVETPSEAVETPSEAVETPSEAVETPSEAVETPSEAVETPSEAVETLEAVEIGDELSETTAPEEAPELVPSETQAPEEAADTEEDESDTVIPEQEELSPKQTEAEEVIQTRTRRSRAKAVNETPTPRVTRSRKSKTPEEIVETTPVKRGRKSTGRKQVTKPEEPALVLEASSAEEDNTEVQPQTADQAPTETAELVLPETAEDTSAEGDTKEQELPQAQEDSVEGAEEPVAAETEDTVEEMAVEDIASAEAAEEEKIEEAASTADVELVPVSTTDEAVETPEAVEAGDELSETQAPEEAADTEEAVSEAVEEELSPKQTEGEEVIQTRTRRSRAKAVNETPTPRVTRSRKSKTPEEIVETTPVKRGRKSTGRKQVTKPEEPAQVLEASSAEEENTEVQPQTADQARTETVELVLPETAEDTSAEGDTKEQEPSLAEEDTMERAEEPVAAETEDTVEEMAVEDIASAEAAEEEKIEEAASTANVELVPVSTTVEAVETPEAVEAGHELSETLAPEEAADTEEAVSEAVEEELSLKQTEAEEVIQTRTRRSRAKAVNETPTPRVTRSRKSKTPEEIVETTPVKRGRKSTGRKQVTKPEEPALVLEASSAEEDNTVQPQIADEAPLETAPLPLPAKEAETDQNEPMEDSEATDVTETKAKEAETVEGTAVEEEIKEQEPSLAEEDTMERAEEPVAAETEDTVEEMAVEDSASAEAAEEEKIEEAASTADVELVPVRTTEAEHKEHSESSIEVDKESQPETVMEEKEAEPEEPEEPAPSVETRSLRSGSKTVKATPGRRRTAARLASQEDSQDKPLEEIINQTEDTAGQSEADLVEPASETSPNKIKDNEKESSEALALEDEDLSAEQNDPEEVTISEATSVGHQAAVDVSDFPRVTVLLVDVNKVHVVKSVTEPNIPESAETTEDAENQNSSLNDEPAPEVETRRVRSRSKIVAATEDTQPSQQTSEEECSTKELIEEPLDHTEEATEAEVVAEGTESSAVAQSTEETKAEEVQKSKEKDAVEQEDQDEPKTRPPKRARKSASAHKRGRFKKARSKPQQDSDVELSSPQDEVTESEGTNDAMPATSLDSDNTQVAGAEESTQEELPETANEEKPIEDQVQQPEERLEDETAVDQEAPAKDEISETEEAEVVSPDNIEDIPSEKESPAPTKTTRRGKPKRSSRKTAKVTSIDEETQAKEKIDETEEAEDVSPDNIEDLPSEEEAPTKTTRRSKPRRSSRKTARVDYADHEEELDSDIIPQSVAKSPAKTRRSARKPQSEEEEASDEGVELNLVLDDDEEQSASDLEVMRIGEKVLRNRAVPYIVSTPQSKSSPLHSAVHSPQESPKQPRKRRSAGATPARRSKRHRD